MPKIGISSQAVEEGIGEEARLFRVAVRKLEVKMIETRGDRVRKVDEDLANKGVASQDELCEVGERSE